MGLIFFIDTKDIKKIKFQDIIYKNLQKHLYISVINLISPHVEDKQISSKRVSYSQIEIFKKDKSDFKIGFIEYEYLNKII